MSLWRRDDRTSEPPEAVAARMRLKYASFRELLALNNESLELMAGLQEDLQFVPPRRDVVGDRLESIFGSVGQVVGALESLTGMSQNVLGAALGSQQQAVEQYSAALAELKRPRLSAWLSEVNAGSEDEIGGKAAVLGEIRNRLGLPVPDGFVLTTEAYRQYCGIPLWTGIRDSVRDLDLADLKAVRAVSETLTRKAAECALPRAIEVAITARSAALLKNGGSLAVRSSGRGEGGERTYAGQFLSLLNVSGAAAVDAYRQVIAGRFSERALFYRLSAGLLEVENPMAALFLLMIPARASGIMYTRDPSDPKSKVLWITATRGLGLEIASGRMPADLFVVGRSNPHPVLERNIVRKEEHLVFSDAGGVASAPLEEPARDAASIEDRHLRTLAEWGVHLEDHLHTPQDVEWVLDVNDRLWTVQSRPLAAAGGARPKVKSRPKGEPRVQGGRTVYPGRTSGQVFLLHAMEHIAEVPDGAVVIVRRPSPEIIEIFPRIAGLVAEWGNVTGHAAALLREFRVPSVFLMTGAFERLTTGEPVSLDAVQGRIYAGTLWPPARREDAPAARFGPRRSDPISARLLTLNLLDPTDPDFRPAGCRSAHDILRYCHEKAIEAMFEVNDYEVEHSGHCSRRLLTELPLNLRVVDLGGGVEPGSPDARGVTPREILSRPFQAFWKGVSHPGVTWTREMPTSIGDLASVLARAFTPHSGTMRPLGGTSYLLVADEYMNLNSRLAYHYSLVDACLSDDTGHNYISFRFEGGGATRERRSLRACFLEACLRHCGFQVHRRTDLVNAWFRKAPADQTAERLDVLGRLIACSSQLDMYMTSREVMNWYVRQFESGNYSLQPTGLDATIKFP
jgi:pyruvate, water dikinase